MSEDDELKMIRVPQFRIVVGVRLCGDLVDTCGCAMGSCWWGSVVSSSDLHLARDLEASRTASPGKASKGAEELSPKFDELSKNVLGRRYPRLQKRTASYQHAIFSS